MAGSTSNRNDGFLDIGRHSQILVGAAIVCLVAGAAYGLALTGQLGLILDDDGLVTENRLVHAPDGLYRMWLTTEPTDYWPVTSTSFWIEWRLWGQNPTGYHVVNLLLHVVECLLLWQILVRLKIPGAFFAALLFAVHPINVESVAWIAQRKNMVAMLFYLLSVLWYLRADKQSGRWNRWHWLSLAAFLLAMLGKGSVAILPLVLLLLTWWQRPLGWLDVAKTAPFFAVAGALTLVNMWFQNHGVEIVLRKVTPLDRLLGAAGVVWFYLYKAILPIHLNFFYPQWQIDAHRLIWWLPLSAFVIVSLLLWWQRKTGWGKAMFTAWAYFCICLLPVMGFSDVGYMKFSLVADHYQHLAIIGVIALVAGSAAAWRSRQELTVRHWSTAAAVALVLLLGSLTFQQSRLYCDADTLYESSLGYSSMAQSTLGGLEMHRGNIEAAYEHYQKALELNANDKTAQIGMALLLSTAGRFDEALTYARRGVELSPTSATAHNQLGIALKRTGHLAEAIDEYREAIRLDREDAFSYNNLAIALANQGHVDDAIEDYQLALKYRPYYVEAHNNLAAALLRKGNLEGAIEHCREALRLDPELFEARKTFGQALLAAGKPAEAVDQLNRFVSRFPNDADVWTALVVANDELNRTDQALAAAEKGLAAARAANDKELVNQLQRWLESVDQHRSATDSKK